MVGGYILIYFLFNMDDNTKAVETVRVVGDIGHAQSILDFVFNRFNTDDDSRIVAIPFTDN